MEMSVWLNLMANVLYNIDLLSYKVELGLIDQISLHWKYLIWKISVTKPLPNNIATS